MTQATKTATTPAAQPAPNATPTNNAPGGSIYASFKSVVITYIEEHGHAVMYGLLGFLTALLMLFIGFWPTVLLALFAGAGVAIGTYQDGSAKMRAMLRSLVQRFK